MNDNKTFLDLDNQSLTQHYHSDNYLPTTTMDTDMIDMEKPIMDNLEPYLEITEQPMDKFRFRYLSEMHGTHGSLTGINSKKITKTYPSVQLHRYNGQATIRCSLYKSEGDVPSQIPFNHCRSNVKSQFQLHPHSLVVRRENEEFFDPHDVVVTPGKYEAIFRGMGIIHTAKKFIEGELLEKYIKKIKFDEHRDISELERRKLEYQAKEEAKTINLNQVRLCFEAFCKDAYDNINYICEPVLSLPINNMKSVMTGELKITRISLAAGSAAGNDDLFLFVEKVGKKNIKVRFLEVNEAEDILWADYGEFSEADVHHQYAIALRTPPYKNINIREKIQVFIQLERPTDNAVSARIPFIYKPRIGNCMYDWAKDDGDNQQMQEEQMSISKEFKKSDVINDLLANTNTTTIDIQFIGFMDYFKNSYELKQFEADLQYDGEFENATKKIYHRLKFDILDIIKKQPTMTSTILEQLIKRKNSVGKNLFHVLIVYGPSVDNILYDLIEKYNLQKLLDLPNFRDETCLHIAVRYNKSDHILPLIRLGADPTKVNIDGDTSLHIAIEKKYKQCVDELLYIDIRQKSILSANIVNYKGMTPLHLAVRQKDCKTVELLLKYGAAVNIPEATTGNSALHLAILNESIDMLKTILDSSNQQVNVNIVNKMNQTPLALVNAKSPLRNDFITSLIAYDTKTGVMSLTLENIKDENDSNDSSLTANKINALTLDNDADNNKYYQNLSDQQLTSMKIDDVGEFATLFDDQCLQQLCNIFNCNNRWEILAEYFNCKQFMSVWQCSKNPSMMLFKFLEVQQVDLLRFVDIFQLVDAKDALCCVDEMVARKTKNELNLQHK